MDSPVLKPQFITNESGERVAVILSMAEFEEISELLEDLADAKEFERRRDEPTIPHAEAMRMVREAPMAVPVNSGNTGIEARFDSSLNGQ